MEGRRGEKFRNLEVYDLKSRRQVDTEVTRRTIDFMTRQVKAAKPFYAHVPFTLVHYPTLPQCAILPCLLETWLFPIGVNGGLLQESPTRFVFFVTLTR